jgi:hypothetical protein
MRAQNATAALRFASVQAGMPCFFQRNQLTPCATENVTGYCFRRGAGAMYNRELSEGDRRQLMDHDEGSKVWVCICFYSVIFRRLIRISKGAHYRPITNTSDIQGVARGQAQTTAMLDVMTVLFRNQQISTHVFYHSLLLGCHLIGTRMPRRPFRSQATRISCLIPYLWT